jgi:hypothetical protein
MVSREGNESTNLDTRTCNSQTFYGTYLPRLYLIASIGSPLIWDSMSAPPKAGM